LSVLRSLDPQPGGGVAGENLPDPDVPGEHLGRLVAGLAHDVALADAVHRHLGAPAKETEIAGKIGPRCGASPHLLGDARTGYPFRAVTPARHQSWFPDLRNVGRVGPEEHIDRLSPICAFEFKITYAACILFVFINIRSRSALFVSYL